jgi:hypothetical protein
MVGLIQVAAFTEGKHEGLAGEQLASATGDSRVVTALKMLGSAVGVFEYNDSTATSMADILKDIWPEVSVKETLPEDSANKEVINVSFKDDYWVNLIDGATIEKTFVFILPDLNENTDSGHSEAKVTELGNGMLYINSAGLISGGSKGSKLYHLLSVYALNNGLKFIGDHGGLSKDGILRRTQNMASSAVRYGTTQHLMPHPYQEIAWGEDDAENFANLIQKAADDILKGVKELDGVEYGFAERKFVNRDGTAGLGASRGESAAADSPTGHSGRADLVGTDSTAIEGSGKGEFTNKDFARVVNTADAKAVKGGLTTLKRAVLYRSLAEKSRTDEGWQLIKDSFFREIEEGGKGGALAGAFYSKRTEKPALELRPFTRTNAQGQVQRLYGIFSPGHPKPLDQFDTATEAAASLKDERADYEAMAAALPKSGRLEATVGDIPATGAALATPEAKVAKPAGPLPPHGRLQRDETPKGTTQGPALSGKVVDQQRSQPVEVAVDEALGFLNQPVEQAIKLKQLLRQYTSVINRGLSSDRAVAAVELLYSEQQELSNQLLELTSFVPDGLPVYDHLAQAVRLIEEHGERNTSIANDASSSQLSDLLYTEEVRNDEVKPHSFTLVAGQYLTKTLGEVLGPLMKLAKQTPAEAAKGSAASLAARQNLTATDRAMLDLIDAATADPKGIAVMELGNAEDLITGKPANEHAKALLAIMQRKDVKGAEANLARGLAKLRTMHDAYGMPYGTVALSFDAKADVFKLTETITTLDPETVRLVYDAKSDEHIPLIDWVKNYISTYAKNGWQQFKDQKRASGEETAFWASRVITFQAYGEDGKPVGKPVPFRASDITRLGYNIAKARRDVAPATPMEAFNAGVASMLVEADQRYVLENASPQALKDKVISK